MVLQYVRKYKSVLRFILTFLGTYLLLTLGYLWYLKRDFAPEHYPDYLTQKVALHSKWLIQALGFTSKIEPHAAEASVKLFVEDQFLVRVVEGCNGASVVILFVAFVLAFADKLKSTLVFLVVGSIAIYIINVLRIALIAIAVYKLPGWAEFLHTIAFPAIIYGFIFLLWVFWVKHLKRKNHA